MDPTPLKVVAEWTGGTLVTGDGEQRVSRVATDTRRLEPGALFVALRGERFDGHAFLAQAAEAGAAAAVIDTGYDGPLPEVEGFAVVRVEETLRALQRMAAAYRATLPLKVVGITGSSGKTSTKDFTAAVLETRYRVVKTQGNLNNHIGLPLSLLSATSQDEIGIFEMGMNHPGEIAPLAAMARPDVAVITNIGVAHIEYMGSRDAIALEKGRLAEALDTDGMLIMPASDDFGDAIAARTGATALFSAIGDDPRANLRAEVLETGFSGNRFRVNWEGERIVVQLPVAGLHMVENALLALSVGLVFGVSLEDGARGLSSSRLTRGRLEQKNRGGLTFLDDSYNANPDSMRAALRTLASLPAQGRRIAVLGRMGELGESARDGHTSVGLAAGQTRMDVVVAVGGQEAQWIAEAALQGGVAEVTMVDDPASAAQWLKSYALPGDLVLIKASRSVQMERIFEHPAFADAEAAT